MSELKFSLIGPHPKGNRNERWTVFLGDAPQKDNLDRGRAVTYLQEYIAQWVATTRRKRIKIFVRTAEVAAVHDVSPIVARGFANPGYGAVGYMVNVRELSQHIEPHAVFME